MAVAPSSLLRLTSQAMGDAQARLRELAITSTSLKTINTLIAKRDAIDAQQRRLMRANLAIVDKDPAVQKNVAQLTQLTGQLAAGVHEMQNATQAIKGATGFISLADKILSLFRLA